MIVRLLHVQVVIELVLATDMKQHFSILSHFTTVHRLNAGGAMTPGTSGSDPMLALRQQARCARPTNAPWPPAELICMEVECC